MERNSSRFRRLRHVTPRPPFEGPAPEKPGKPTKPATVWAWLVAHKKAIGGGLTATIVAAWAVVELVWPSLILPMFDSGRVDISVKVNEVARTSTMSSQEIQIEIKNSSSTRVYLPATFMQVRAQRLPRPLEKPKAGPPSQTPEQIAKLKEVLPELTNLVFRQQLDAHRATDDFRTEFDVRSPYFIDEKATVMLQFSRFTGINVLLEPGESVKVQRVAFVPPDYELMTVYVVSRATKRFAVDLGHFGFPAATRPKIFTFPREPYLVDGKFNYEKFKKEITLIKEDPGTDMFDSVGMIEAYVGPKPPKAKE